MKKQSQPNPFAVLKAATQVWRQEIVDHSQARDHIYSKLFRWYAEEYANPENSQADIDNLKIAASDEWCKLTGLPSLETEEGFEVAAVKVGFTSSAMPEKTLGELADALVLHGKAMAHDKADSKPEDKPVDPRILKAMVGLSEKEQAFLYQLYVAGENVKVPEKDLFKLWDEPPSPNALYQVFKGLQTKTQRTITVKNTRKSYAFCFRS